jgi:hemoglobin
MGRLPEVKQTRDLHAKSLKVLRKKLFMFLSGWLGSPQLYVEQHGHPRVVILTF